MKIIRFWSSAPFGKEQWQSFFELPPDEFQFVRDDVEPQYLLVSEHVYTKPALYRRFLELDDGKRISVYRSGECITPDMNLFDYAVAFDRRFVLEDRLCRKPAPLFFKQGFSPDLTHGAEDASAELSRKERFCNFIYSNRRGHVRRDQLFYALSEYKPVDALGKHLHNRDNPTSREARNWGELLVEMKRPYKFSIASENAVYRGYVTEKLISSFMAHTVPIYWGDPTVAEEFNPKAFLNANGMDDRELVEAVRRIDEDDELWKAMVSEPMMTPEQYHAYEDGCRHFREWSRSIFGGEVPAKRTPEGFWPSKYRHAIYGSASRLHQLEFAFKQKFGLLWRSEDAKRKAKSR